MGCGDCCRPRDRHCAIGGCAPPQVPSLPVQPADYVDYAITNLPADYSSGAVAATNNNPDTNPITDAGATLGRVLFYDKRLSVNNTVACASCHQQSKGFSDSNQFSSGFDGQLTGATRRGYPT